MPGPSRNLAAARGAFAAGDETASRQAHAIATYQEPGHTGEDPVVACAVYGGLEGAAVALVLVSVFCSDGADDNFLVHIAICIATLAVVLGLREFVHSRSDHEHWHREREREMWELELFPEGEIKEMIEIYTENFKVGEADATSAIRTLAKYKELFVDMMMHQELEIPRPMGSPVMRGLAAAAGFGVFGALPPFTYFWISRLDDSLFVVGEAVMSRQLATIVVAALITSVLLGCTKLILLRQRRRIWLVAAIFVVMCVAGLIAHYFVAHDQAVASWIGVERTPVSNPALDACALPG